MKSDDTGARIVDKRKNWEARVEMAIFKLPRNELSTYDKLVYAILCGHANRDGNAMLYVRTIAEEASCSERQVQRALSNLEVRRLLLRRPQGVQGQGQTFNLYEVYGFDDYIPCDHQAQNTQGCQEEGCSGIAQFENPATVTQTPGDSQSPHPVTDCHSPGVWQAGLNNVFK